ncbi:MAG: hypothetical protein Q4G06_10410, partial [Clostridia bacterium]|nr:hypothetical protein [Clostridia bacterium]
LFYDRALISLSVTWGTVQTKKSGWYFCLLRQLQIAVTYVYAPAALQWIAAAGSAPKGIENSPAAGRACRRQ